MEQRWRRGEPAERRKNPRPLHLKRWPQLHPAAQKRHHRWRGWRVAPHHHSHRAFPGQRHRLGCRLHPVLPARQRRPGQALRPRAVRLSARWRLHHAGRWPQRGRVHRHPRCGHHRGVAVHRGRLHRHRNPQQALRPHGGFQAHRAGDQIGPDRHPRWHQHRGHFQRGGARRRRRRLFGAGQRHHHQVGLLCRRRQIRHRDHHGRRHVHRLRHRGHHRRDR